MHPDVLLEMTAEPAFATDEAGRLVAWNAAAERLLGYSAQQVVGRSCREITCGTDRFGNRYCREDCNPRQMLASKDPIHGFEIDIRSASGERVRVHVSILVVRGPAPSQYLLVHLVRPARAGGEAGASEHASEQGVLADPPVASPTMREREAEPAGPLSAREREVLTHLAEGSGVAEISRSLSISESTVRTHVENIFRKLDAHSRLEAVAIARRRKLLP